MARYAWKSTGADGTEATGTFAFTSLNRHIDSPC